MIYNRFAASLSESLFNSIYSDLFELAASEQATIWNSCNGNRKTYRVGENQEALNAFCHGKLSLGSALDHINSRKPAEVQQ